MRFIRDIIAEKRVDVPHSEGGHTADAPVSDLTFELDQFDLLSEDAAPHCAVPPASAPPVSPPPAAAAEDMDEIDLSILKSDASPSEDDTNPEPDPLDRLLADAVQSSVPSADPEPDPVPEPAKDDPLLLKPEQIAPAVEAPPRNAPDADTPATAEHAEPPIAPPQEPIPEPVSSAIEVPRPAAGRSAGRTGRVKTRLLGFGEPQDAGLDPFDKPSTAATSTHASYPVGWLIVVDGPGRGAAFTIYDGVASIGRDPGQVVPLAFGDNSISRENHAAIAYDDEQRGFFLGHGGKANLVRLNGKPVLSTEELSSDDTIRIGETTLRFIALCGADFSWSQTPNAGGGYASAT